MSVGYEKINADTPLAIIDLAREIQALVEGKTDDEMVRTNAIIQALIQRVISGCDNQDQYSAALSQIFSIMYALGLKAGREAWGDTTYQ